jgi:hypothetical protein
MADTDSYPDRAIQFSNFIVDQKEYLTATSLDDCFSRDHSYYQDDYYVYVHFDYHYPPYLFVSMRYGTIIGITNSSSITFELAPSRRFLYKHGLREVSPIVESADPLTYSRMQFNAASYTLDNTLADFDAISDIFGNEFSVRVGLKGQPYSQYKKLMQYYISNLSITLEQAILEVKDKRERLSVKIPSTQYTKEAYPHINDKQVGKVMQETYGKCLGVKGVCIDETDAYTDDAQSIEKTYRSFRFSREITSITKIEVKMTDKREDMEEWSKDNDEGWTVVKPVAVVIDDKNYPDGIDCENGIIFLDYYHVLPLKNTLPDVTRGVYDVRADGVFNEQQKPKDVIIDLLERYAGIPFHEDWYDMAEFTRELQNLPEIGLCIDKEQDVFAVIEQIQNGSLLGFQFMAKFNVFSARLDNPNRPESFEIKRHDILNLQEVTINWNADLYASYTDIKYNRSYTPNKDTDEYQHVIDKSIREQMLERYRIEKVLEVETILPDEASAALKGKLLLEDFLKLRPVISGIQLFGMIWFDLQLYDTGYIDFSISGEEIALVPRRIVQLLNYLGAGKEHHIYHHSEEEEKIVLIPPEDKKLNRHGRTFVGRLRCQIIRREIDPNTGVVTIDVRQQDRSALQPF